MSNSSVDYEPAEHYDRVTEAWLLLMGDELHYGVFEHGDEPLALATAALTERMIDAAGLRRGRASADGSKFKVLDVGCGSGAPACGLATTFGVQVVGITTSAVGVAKARARAAGLGVAGVSFEQRDGTDNGFSDEEFDLVWVLESSHLMRDRERLISECARVLRPGGRVVLCDLMRFREIPFHEVRDRLGDFATLRTAFGDAHMETPEFYSSAMHRRGLTVNRTVDLTAATLPTFDRWRRNAGQHLDDVKKLIGADGLDAFVRSCDVLEASWRDGTFGYGLISASKPK
jgi:cyclopropane fatty-acyl-phospholipid synthase-like methyltransferase